MTNRTPLRKIVIAIETQPERIDLLRHTFPEITFAVASQETLNAEAADADGMLTGFATAEGFLKNAPQLRWIQNQGAGVERLMTDELRSREIVVTNGSGIMAPNMAEHIVAMMLTFARGLVSHVAAQRDQKWREGFPHDRVFELTGQTVVLVGLGDIAQEAAKRLKGFGVTVIGVRRSDNPTPPEFVDEVVSIGDLNSVLGRADHVVSSVPSTPETQGLFDRDRIAAFKPGAYFYNVGRGTAVIQEALIEALESGHVAGAGLDVTDPEPLPVGDALWTAPNVLITSHTSGSTPHFHDRLFALFTENIRRYQAGDELVNVVDASRGY